MNLLKKFVVIMFISFSFILIFAQNITTNSCAIFKNYCLESSNEKVKTDEEKIMKAINNITFDNVVKDDLYFPINTIYDVNISWHSHNPNIITNSGEVNRPYNDYEEVKVEAEFSLPKFSYTKTYTFYVIPQYNDESLKNPVSEEWLNNLKYEREVGSLTLENRTYYIYIDNDYISSSRLYTVDR